MRVRDRRITGVPAQNDALSHAMAMVAVPAVLGYLGSLLDGWLDTDPVFLIGLAILGVIGSFASAFYRYEARVAEHDIGKPWAPGIEMRRAQASSPANERPRGGYPASQRVSETG